MVYGIFGDSFADGKGLMNKLNPLSWTNILQTEYNLKIKNYAYGCTSAFWSFTQLKNNIRQVDAVIFVLSNSRRIYTPDINLHICNINVVENYLKKDDFKSFDEKCKYIAAKEYYLHLSQNEFNVFVHEQITKEIKRLCIENNKPFYLIPTATDDIEYQNIFKLALIEITTKEHRLNFPDHFIRKETSMRPNHMSSKNNKILADKVYNMINGDTTPITLDNFVFEKYDDLSIYWEEIN